MKRSSKAAAVMAAAAIAVVPATGAMGKPHHHHKPKPKPVKVVDDYFAPTDLSIKSGEKLKFKWDKTNTNSHNVTLQKGPKGVNKSDFKSATGSIGVKFAAKFKKKGTYNFICTIHPETMKLTVTVKR